MPKMGLPKKTPPQLSAGAGDGRNSKKGAENLANKIRKPFVNHWAILDEIEAPMWADLNLECNSAYEDKDEEWFYISHPFHQCSARKLRNMNSASGIQEQSSPKIQSSVSKTSDEDYKCRKLEPVSCRSTLTNQHHLKSLSSKSLLGNGGIENSIKDKALDGKVCGENNSAETNATVSSKSAYSFSNRNTSTKSVTITTTSEVAAGKQSQPSILPFGSSSMLLSNLRESLRKSYVTRPASRVEMKGMRKSEGSLSKSSVGSTSDPGRDGMKSVITENMDKTPESRNLMMMPEHPTDNLNQDRKKQTEGCVVRKANKYIPPTSNSYTRETGINRSTRTLNGGKENQSWKMALDIKTSMRMKKQTEVCVTQGVKKCIPLSASGTSVRAAGGITRSSISVNGGKENQTGKMVMPIKSNMRMKEGEGQRHDPKGVKNKLHEASDRTKFAGQKETHNAGSKVKKQIGMVHTVHFR